MAEGYFFFGSFAEIAILYNIRRQEAREKIF